MRNANRHTRRHVLSTVICGLGLWICAPAYGVLTSFGVTPAMQPGDSMVVYILNGQTGQNITVTLFDPTGVALITKSATLGSAGSASESLTVSWTNSGAALSHVTIQIDASGYFYNAADGAVYMFVTGYSSAGFMAFAVDRQSFLTPISHDHSPGNPDNPVTPTTTNPFTLTTLQNYPNPFKSSQGTHFLYGISGSTSTDPTHSHVIIDPTAAAAAAPPVQNIDIRIWSSSGHLVKSLGVSTTASRGVIAWDGKDESGKPVATGIYVAEILVNSQFSFSTRLKLAAIGGN